MTAHDIFRIALTVATTQLGCDLLANHLVFSRESYRRAISTLDRAQVKLQKLTSTSSGGEKQSAKAQEKQTKKLQRAQDDCSEASADVAKRHMAPSFWTSVMFIVLHRILGTEYSGKVLAILPFVPFRLLRRFTQWGLSLDGLSEWKGRGVADVNQACGFLFVYILCTISVKFVVHKIVGFTAPKGADRGVMTLVEAPKSQRLLKSFGVDMDELKNQ